VALGLRRLPKDRLLTRRRFGIYRCNVQTDVQLLKSIKVVKREGDGEVREGEVLLNMFLSAHAVRLRSCVSRHGKLTSCQGCAQNSRPVSKRSNLDELLLYFRRIGYRKPGRSVELFGQKDIITQRGCLGSYAFRSGRLVARNGRNRVRCTTLTSPNENRHVTETVHRKLAQPTLASVWVLQWGAILFRDWTGSGTEQEKRV